MPKPPQLGPLDVETQQLPGDRALHPVPTGAPSHPTAETHFGGHQLLLMGKHKLRCMIECLTNQIRIVQCCE